MVEETSANYQELLERFSCSYLGKVAKAKIHNYPPSPFTHKGIRPQRQLLQWKGNGNRAWERALGA